jgi:hypothetical protein
MSHSTDIFMPRIIGPEYLEAAVDYYDRLEAAEEQAELLRNRARTTAPATPRRALGEAA